MSEGCVLCGSAQVEVVSRVDRRGRPLVTVLCGGCGVLRNDPVPGEAELEAFYRRDYRTDYKGAAEPRKRQVFRNLDRLQGHILGFADIYGQGGDWLDLGSGSGEFSFLAQHLGARVTAVEPNEGYAAYCRTKLDLPVTVGRMEDCGFAPASFDLIRLSHVLEHMRDPVASLERLKGWLRPGGVIYVEVPDIESDARNKMRGRLFHYGHIYNYNPLTLRHVAGRAGLVELASTAARSAGRCGAFFVAGEGGLAGAEQLAANAARMRAAMAAHEARRLPEPAEGTAAGRFLATLSARLREAVAGARHGSHRAIADAAAGRMRASLSRG